MADRVTNEAVLVAFRGLGITVPDLDMTGAQNSAWKKKLYAAAKPILEARGERYSLDAFDKVFAQAIETAKKIKDVPVDAPPLDRLVLTLGAYGVKEEEFRRIRDEAKRVKQSDPSLRDRAGDFDVRDYAQAASNVLGHTGAVLDAFSNSGITAPPAPAAGSAGAKVAPAPGAPSAPAPVAPSPSPVAPAHGEVRQDISAAPARPTQPLAPKPKAGAPGATLAGPTTTAPQQTPGIKNLPTLPPNASEAQVEEYVRKNYGYSAWILDVPELRGKMLELGKEFAGTDVDEARIEGALTGTEWWKTHEGDQRLAIEERLSDPATYNAKIEGKYRALGALAGQIGFSVGEGRLREIARTAYDAGWDQNEMRSALAAEFDYDPTTGAQDQSKVVGDLRQLASEYLVPLGEQTIDQWGRQIVAGTSTNEDFTEYAKGMAKGMFSHYAADIDAGRTVRQIADPFVQMAAKDLELTSDQVNLEDPKWRKALELDPETGQPMQLSKWQRTIRSDSTYGWDTTQNARGEAAEFSRKIAEAFGRT